MKNNIFITGVVLLAVVLTGCTGDQYGNQHENQYETIGRFVEFKENTVVVKTGDITKEFKVDKESKEDFFWNGEKVRVKKVDENKFELESYYENVGEIGGFNDKENTVTIVNDDILTDYKVDKDSIKNFYVGETAGVKKVGENKFELEKYDVFYHNDDIVRSLGEGRIIATNTGEVKEVNNNSSILKTDNGDLKLYSFILRTDKEDLELYSKELLEKGSEVVVEYEYLNDAKVVVDIYKEKVDLTVKNIRREAGTGVMILDTENEEGLKNVVYVTEYTTLYFNHYDLKENDNISVYSGNIDEINSGSINARIIMWY
ncbi:hypothetical protein VQL36_05750 [Chengkuizengella sp. SCS-71B]|uniref:hypothetical protein n=1 Tax=Chengkuizengella sp. SCS-71B TaxID=3115290 RepID=UPI0032C23BE1